MSIDRIPLPVRPPVDGALLLCALRDVGTDPEQALSDAGGADLLVCLNEASELTSRYPGYREWLVANAPDRALWFPMQDFTASGPEAARPVVEYIVSRLRTGERVLMHCALGQGRAGTMAVCVLLGLGASLEDALAIVAENRRHGGPEGMSQWALVEAIAGDSVDPRN